MLQDYLLITSANDVYLSWFSLKGVLLKDCGRFFVQPVLVVKRSCVLLILIVVKPV